MPGCEGDVNVSKAKGVVPVRVSRPQDLLPSLIKTLVHLPLEDPWSSTSTHNHHYCLFVRVCIALSLPMRPRPTPSHAHSSTKAVLHSLKQGMLPKPGATCSTQTMRSQPWTPALLLPAVIDQNGNTIILLIVPKGRLWCKLFRPLLQLPSP